jgi:Omp85 superfamily domain
VAIGQRARARCALPWVVVAWAAASGAALAQQTVPQPQGVEAAPPAPEAGWAQYLNPLKWPFIPIPVVITDPNSGTTIGLLPTWLRTDDQNHIDQIIAPDVQHNPYFGWGAHARFLAYPSENTDWSIVAGAFEKVQRRVDLEYEAGRLREERWYFSTILLYQRDGTPRFYGIGNGTPKSGETDYTSNQELAGANVGLNFNKAWQLLYTLRSQQVDVLPGTLPGIPSIQKLYGEQILGTGHEVLQQLSLVYDTRDDLTMPTRGVRLIAYGGIAKDSAFGPQRYNEVGVDGRAFWPIRATTVVAAHIALRYLPATQDVAFWELSTIGGGQSVVGGEQPLRGFGEGRFTDRNSSSMTVEVRQRVLGVDLFKTHTDLEVAPFVDLGEVFERMNASPVSQLHKVIGLGFRGIARPFVVAYVDVGYGSEGAAVFTGLNYPF